MATPTTRPERQAGATPLTTEDHRSKKPLWLLLALLALAALAVLAFLLIRNAADDGDDGGVDTTDDPSGGSGGGTDASGDGSGGSGGSGGGQSTASTEAGGSATTEAGGSATTAAPSGTGELATTAGETVVPPPSGGLGDLAGEQVTGTAMVESVVSDEGFWVGDGPGQRVFVFLTPEARNSEGESPFQVEAGQTIELTGSLVAAPADPASVGVEGSEGADELTGLGAYIEATEVALSE